MPPLVVLMPPKARQVGDWIVVDLPRHYDRKESSKSEGVERRADSEEECAKHAQHAGQRAVQRAVRPPKFHRDR